MNLIETEHFLEKCLGNIDDSQDLLLWVLHPTSEKKRSLFVHDVATALAALQQYDGWHWYWGVGLRPRQTTMRENWRGSEADVTGLLCLHLDLDIAHPIAHKAERLPQTHEDVQRILTQLPLRPSLTVHSGYGLQALWWFKEPELLTTTQDRLIAKDTARRLHAAAAQIASAHGWVIDATFDLSRVLRLPGSENYKVPPTAVPCRILDESGPQYTGLSDFLDVFPPLPTVTESATLGEFPAWVKDACQGLKLTHGAFSFDRLEVLQQNDAKFKRTWKKQRTDLKNGTQSAYDMSIAMLALHAGISPQDVLSLIERFRTERQREEKPLSYYVYTIQNAYWKVHAGKNDADAALSVDAAVAAAEDEARMGALCAQDQENRQALFDEVAVYLEFPEGYRIIDVFFVEATPPIYELLISTPSGKLALIQLTPTTASSLSSLGIAVLSVTNNMITKGGKNALSEWKNLFNRLRLVAVVQKEVEASTAGILHGWLARYTQRAPALDDVTEEQREDWIRQGSPFLMKDRVLFSFDAFFSFLKVASGPPLNRGEASRLVRAWGGVNEKLNLPWSKGSRTSRRYWNLPQQALTQLPELTANGDSQTPESNVSDSPMNTEDLGEKNGHVHKNSDSVTQKPQNPESLE